MMMMMSVERRGGVGWDEGEERTNERGIREDDKEARERESTEDRISRKGGRRREQGRRGGGGGGEV